MKDKILDIKNLNAFINDDHILNDINLDIKKGEIILICGKSGSGKSTLASVLSGYYKNIGGKISYDKLFIEDINIEDIKTYERYPYLSVSYQNARLSFATNNLRQELIFILENLSYPRENMDSIIESHVKKYGLSYILDQDFDSLSGGQLQMASFCAIKLLDSKLYILDEPFANLDDKNANILQEFIKKDLKEKKTYIVIDHRLDMWNFVDRICLINEEGYLVDIKKKSRDLSENDKKLLIKNGLILDENIHIKKNQEKDQVIIKAKDLSVSYGKNQILKNTSFEFEKNKLIALTGPSGSGKSTLFKVLLKKLPYQGFLKIGDEKLSQIKIKDFYKKIGLIFQDPTLQFIRTNVADELGFNLKINKEEIIKTLNKYKLGSYVEKSPWILSQGEQRRLAVLVMLLLDKQILLVDEPSYGQDMANAIKIMDDLKEISKTKTVIFSSHDKKLVDLYADVIFKIENKELIRYDR